MGRPRPKQKRLGQKLRQIRKELDISQDRMPERLGRPDLHPGRISEYEQNKREPSLLTLLSYAKLAGVHLEDIVNDNVDLPAQIPGDVQHVLPPAISEDNRQQKRFPRVRHTK